MKLDKIRSTVASSVVGPLALAAALMTIPVASHAADGTVTPAFSEAIPNIPGKNLIAVVVDYPPGGKTPAHHHAKSAFITGYVLSGFTGHITAADLHNVLDQPLIALPQVSHLSYAFDWQMVIPFAVTGLAAAMSATAVVTTYQRINDADWVRPDMTSISGGIFGMECSSSSTHSLMKSTFLATCASTSALASSGVETGWLMPGTPP